MLVLLSVLAALVFVGPVLRSDTIGMSRRTRLLGWLGALFGFCMAVAISAEHLPIGSAACLLFGSMFAGAILLFPMIRPGVLETTRKTAGIAWLGCWVALTLGCEIAPETERKTRPDTNQTTEHITRTERSQTPSPPTAGITTSTIATTSTIPQVPKNVTGHDLTLRSRFRDFYNESNLMDCVNSSREGEAIDLVLRALKREEDLVGHHGGPIRLAQKARSLGYLSTRKNLKGEGDIVIAALDDVNTSADRTRRRTIWLVLDGKVYPVHTEAASALGFLFDGVPDEIAARAGFKHSYERGNSALDQLGLDDYSRFRFHGSIQGIREEWFPGQRVDGFFPLCVGTRPLV